MAKSTNFSLCIYFFIIEKMVSQVVVWRPCVAGKTKTRCLEKTKAREEGEKGKTSPNKQKGKKKKKHVLNTGSLCYTTE